MASSLTYGSLRQLARLYRVGIDGAADALAMLVDEHANELPELLGFPMANLDRLRAHDDPVGVLVATIEGAPRVARGLRERIHYDGAAALALQLGETATPREGGHLALDVELLVQTLRFYPGRVVTFGERGSLGSLRLRAVLRELRGVTATSVVVTREHVVVAYESTRSRGLIKLALSSTTSRSSFRSRLSLRRRPRQLRRACRASSRAKNREWFDASASSERAASVA